MAIPKIATRGLDSETIRRRVSESINNIVDFTFDDWRRRTAAEISAGITPTNYAYPPGNVLRYGANSVPGTTDMTDAIQAALGSNSEVFIPDGNYLISDTLLFYDGTVLRFESRNAVILGDDLTKAMLKGYDAANTRRYHLQIYSGTFDNQDRANAGAIAIDLYAATMCKVFGTFIKNVETGVRNAAAGALGCFYNEFHGVDISTVDVGYQNGELGNHIQVFGGRVNDCVTGTIDDDNSDNAYYGLAIEAFTSIGHDCGPSAVAAGTRYIASRVENVGGVGTGFRIGSGSVGNVIAFPYMTGLATEISDSGSVTAICMPYGSAAVPLLKFNGGTGISKHLHVTVTRDVANLAAGAFRQEGPITVTGAAVGDDISVTLPAAWPNNVMVGAPIISGADTVYLPVHNPSGGDVDPASGDFQFSIWKHV